MKKIVLVCTGNTCRSPLAGVLLQDLLPEEKEYLIESAGISAFPGQRAAEMAHRAARERGLDLSTHQSQQLSDEMVREADLILTMTVSQARRLRLSHREESGIIYTLGEFIGRTEIVEDPVGEDLEVYRQTRDQLEKLLKAAVERIPEFFSQAGDYSDSKNYNKRRFRMKLAIGSDHAGFPLKENLKDWLKEESGHEVIDFGASGQDSVDYPDYARKVSRAVASHEAELGILICGTGIGMSMAANKVKGIRAARCQDCYSARMARSHNNANILTLGDRVLGTGLAREIVSVFLEEDFAGERHQSRVDKIMQLEKEMKD